ncbi:MAG: hypothetical protein L7V86_26785, partial [Verrucomicrobiales bacterium]|nr:hypothetical protein [Verrucomicrobiales bacterium]
AGIAIDSPNGQFRARHLNARRIVFGSLSKDSNQSLPALWRQRADAPITTSNSQGRIECANDEILCRAAGHTVQANGVMRPSVWEESKATWIETSLPVPAFCVGGNALGISDNGVICGFAEIKIAPTPNRLPCVWAPGESGGYKRFTVLPTPTEVKSAVAIDINRRGTVVGYSEDRDGTRRACRWNPTATGWVWEDLGVEGAAVSINWLGSIVGGNPDNSYLWQCEERFDLNALLKQGNEPSLDRVYAIGELGDLIGISGDQGRVLTPVTTLSF